MFRIYCSLFLFLTITAVGKDKTPYLNSKLPVEIRVEDLLKRMTMTEKIGQLCQYVSPDHARNSNPNSEKKDYMQEIDAISVDAPNLDEVSKKIIKGEIGSFLHVFSWQEANYLQALAQESRLKIPLLMGIDAVHGNGMHAGNTIYPTSISMASTFNPNLIEIIGEQTAKEMRAAGMHWTFNPNVELTRDARWGRTGETFGEDPLLVGRMGASLIRGLQGQDNLLSDRVIACAKHMIGGGEPAGGLNAAPMDMSERKLRELYLPPFETAVKSNVFTVMPAHNELNGIPCHANSYLLKTILREELGFTGFVISDWMDIERLHSMHAYSSSEEEAFVDAVKAGVDMHMHGPRFLEAILKAVEEGQIPEERIDNAVKKILEAKFRLGLFENPFVSETAFKENVFIKEHQETALQAARQSIVLLKNSDNILPLDREKVNKIFISGPVANSQTILGDWALLQPEENVSTVYKGIKEVHRKAIIDTLFFSNNIVGMDEELIQEAGKKAKEADINIVVVGENSLRYDKNRTCGENKDRDNLDLPGRQQELLEAVYKSGKPTILVLLNGRPLSVTWADKNIPAILEAWEPGSFGGIAIAEILFGDVNPSGKLPITFPRNVGQIQTVYNYKPSQYTRTFVLSPTGALYPFGYGLSYTSFTYGEPKIEKKNYKIGETIEIEVPVTNTGDREGSEIVQLYIRGLYGSVTRPVKELKEFSREENIQPGETRKVKFTLTPETFRCFSANNKWEVEPGKYHIMVGSSSRNKDLQKIEIQLTE